ncbi:MAG: PIN domain-containing protein [Bacteroidetes bacterium]|nr:PIN domain-containing protein [Bacteroidota bacterium]
MSFQNTNYHYLRFGDRDYQVRFCDTAKKLYPAPIRDLLLSVANEDVFKSCWTQKIQDEWYNNPLLNRPDLKRSQLDETIKAMNVAFPEANQNRYSLLFKNINLLDPDDRHVVAAAIRAKANYLVTYNLKDFPELYLNEFNISVQHPDIFLTNLFEHNNKAVSTAFVKMVNRLKNPPKTAKQVLEILAKLSLNSFTTRLRNEE